MYDNGVANVLKIIGIIEIIGGVFLGIIVGRVTTEFMTFIFITSSSVAAGFLFIGLGEVITLLEGNSYRNRNIEEKLILISKQLEAFQPDQKEDQVEEAQLDETTEQPNSRFDAPDNVSLAIKSHYPKQWIGMKSVKQTPIENYYVAMYEDDYEVVHFEGDNVRLIESSDEHYEDIQQWIEENQNSF